MWNRKELKKASRENLKNNYWTLIAVAFLIAFLTTQYGTTTALFTMSDPKSGIENGKNVVESVEDKTLSKKVYDFFTGNAYLDEGYKSDGTKLTENITATKGVLGTMIMGVSKASDIFYNVYKSYSSFIVSHDVFGGFMALLSAFLAFILYVFLANILIVGEKRVFLESRMYKKTRTKRILFVYHERKTFHVAKIMLIKGIFLILWAFTIVGVFVKMYEYRMIAYLLAENPEMTRKEAFSLSKELMMGNKWKLFVLDLSFLPWLILGALTAGLVNIFFLNPYIRGTEAELYMNLRAKAKEAEIKDAALMNDFFIGEVPCDGGLCEFYPGLLSPKEHKPKVEYHRHYSLINLFMFFFTFCMIGWVWEVLVFMVQEGEFVKRGFLHGPWLPIYGFGGVAIIVLLRKLIDHPVILFFTTMILCGIIEYVTATVYWDLFHHKLWDYTGYFMNIQGKVCLEGLLVFAIGGIAVTYEIAPILDDFYNKIPKGVKLPIVIVLTITFVGDVLYSYLVPNAAGQTSLLEESPGARKIEGKEEIAENNYYS
ncbi:MAG: DUF975 family protein [Anaerovoracaceae bacterium]